MATADVELDIFSGLPNPTWTLSDEQTASLLEMVSALSQTEARPRSGDLGYRGMVVRIRDAAARELYLHDGIVEVSGNYYSDRDRRVARWLLDTGRSFVDQSIYEIAEGKL
jgi:hypothetical protein